MNAEMLRNMRIIAEDENLLKRATKYFRKLVTEKESESTRLSKEVFLNVLKKHVNKRGRLLKLLRN